MRWNWSMSPARVNLSAREAISVMVHSDWATLSCNSRAIHMRSSITAVLGRIARLSTTKWSWSPSEAGEDACGPARDGTHCAG